MNAHKNHVVKRILYIVIYSIVTLVLFFLDVHNDIWDDDKFKNL